MSDALWVGLDVGSTTVKVAVWDPVACRVTHSRYERHFADQVGTARRLLLETHDLHPGRELKLACCGSGGQPVVASLGGSYIQEVVACSVAIRHSFPRTMTAVELGGQDAKVLFFRRGENGGRPQVTDMRMNGVCAGGTGAFLDQMSELLSVKPDGFGELAREGRTVYDVSGRCGVFAKTDVQPLLNAGVAPADLALSCLHALVRQVIGGLAQGMELGSPLLLLGGPFHYHPRLVTLFAERLGLSREEVILPENPERVVSLGAALSIGQGLDAQGVPYRGKEALHQWVATRVAQDPSAMEHTGPFFPDATQAEAYRERRRLPAIQTADFPPGSEVPVFLGVDGGSTTLKVMATDRDGKPLWRFYRNNGGKPLEVVKEALTGFRGAFAAREWIPQVLAVATTGYGEHLMAKALGADTHTVETVAHAEAARQVCPDVSFILDIGGQDMKAIWMRDGIITRIVLNEACSAGCGSFLEGFAKTLGVAVDQVAECAFTGRTPSRLGSRCTVFMNSSVTTEQRNGMGPDDILAGLCRSVVENVFTKVVRIPHPGALGPKVLVQGGTFKNDAVLKAFEDRLGMEVTRAPFPGEMGAWGAALLARRNHLERSASGTGAPSRFIGLENLESFTWESRSGDGCPHCGNHCNRSVVTFAGGAKHVTGHRCERGEVLGDPGHADTRRELAETKSLMERVPDTARFQNKVFFRGPRGPALLPHRGITIGIPRVLEFWNSFPFWQEVFHALGFTVKVSPPSSFAILEKGLSHVPSDTVCLPAKLSHGHVEALLDMGVDRIFMPKVFTLPGEEKGEKGIHQCAVLEGTPLVIQETQNPGGRREIPLLSPAFCFHDPDLKRKQIAAFMADAFGICGPMVEGAIDRGDGAMADYHRQMAEAGRNALRHAEEHGGFAVLLAGRPYHMDPFLHHELSRHFTRLGVPVVVPDAFPLGDADLSRVRSEILNPFHGRLYAAATRGAAHPNLEVVQLVSFGCGHDAVTSDEMERVLLEAGGKGLLVLKLDEGDARGPLAIRIQSFVETVRRRRSGNAVAHKPRSLPPPFPVSYEKHHRGRTDVWVPNLAPAMGPLITGVLRRRGYQARLLEHADARAIELGKKYVHNDACYPALLNIGEMLRALEKGTADPACSALAVAKSCKECRAGQYATLARKALDDAGYPRVAVVTSGEDTKKGHPGYRMGTRFRMGMIWGLAMADAMTDLLLSTRPYEVHKGSADALFDRQLNRIGKALEQGTRPALVAFRRAVEAWRHLKVDRSVKRSRVFVTGEILVNFHPGANRDLVKYLEGLGMEVHLPHLLSFFRVDTMRDRDRSLRGFTRNPKKTRLVAAIEERLFKRVLAKVQPMLAGFPHLEKGPDLHEVRRHIEPFIDPMVAAGEGWLIPGEILGWASRGVSNFVIVQPFGCMPNHITGRGLVKTLKKRLPESQILCLDYDPDGSAANIENRLLMMVLSDRQKRREDGGGHPIIPHHDEENTRSSHVPPESSDDPAAAPVDPVGMG